MPSPDRHSLRETFNEDAERYDRARPTYPSQLVIDLVDVARVGLGTRVLEIGPGTGQLTVALAEYGCRIVGVELGADLAALAARNLARFPEVSIEVAAFEHWQPTEAPFDVVVAATAFHWLDPAIRTSKVADLLCPGGILATVATHHIADGSDGFFRDAQRCYQRWDPTSASEDQLPTANDVPLDTGDPALHEWFEPPVFRRYQREITYTAHSFVDLLLTYSGHRALPPLAQEGLLSCIARCANERHSGTITKRYLHELRIAKLRCSELASAEHRC